MRKFLIAVAVTLLPAAVPVFAQDAADCSDLSTQMEMNDCSAQDYEAANSELNLQYRETRAALARLDAGLAKEQRGAEKALMTAQRSWIGYRDAQCELDGFQVRGGSMEPMLVSSCAAEMTRRRTGELKEIAAQTE